MLTHSLSPLHFLLDTADWQAFFKFVKPELYSQQVLICDENTFKYCRPKLLHHWPWAAEWPCVVIPSGEAHKTLETCQFLWQRWQELGLDRHSLVWNLGGGVLGDLAGFAAATYKRGLDFVQLPTSLLSMVDASVGGKLGVDFQGYKNQIGLFQEPLAVGIAPKFLQTLPLDEWRSGWAEMLKHGLIGDVEHWRVLGQYRPDNPPEAAKLLDLIRQSLQVKQRLVERDPYEQGERRLLNFGHTFGHAIESLSWTGGRSALRHGEAVAWGMLLAAKLSQDLVGLSAEALQSIHERIELIYPPLPWADYPLEALMPYLKADKKNEAGQWRFILLKDLGNAWVYPNCREADLQAAWQWIADLALIRTPRFN